MKTNRGPPIINQFPSFAAEDAVLYKQLDTKDNDDWCETRRVTAGSIGGHFVLSHIGV